MDYKNCETSLGLWAPTLRYHNGTFYIINTFVSEGREARRDNYIITASEPGGPYSRAHMIEGADGIDSSLFFDRDGRMWYVGNYISEEALYEGHHGIHLCELDTETFQFKGQRTIIWDGRDSASKWIEAPHLYYEHGFYYLLAAEGGTFTNHSVMMARSRTIDGTYEICPRNPVVTHRHLSLNREISVVGHGDIIETQNGEWWMVLLGVRPYTQAGETSGHQPHFNCGRETFLIPVCWETDGWLRVDNANGLVNARERMPDLPTYTPAPAFFSDNFESPRLHDRWNTIHPAKDIFYSLSEHPGCLRLYLRPEVLEEITTPAFIGRRQQHECFRMKASMDFFPETGTEEAGLALVQDDRYHYTYTVTKKAQQRMLCLMCTDNRTKTCLAETPLPDTGRVYLTVAATLEGYSFYYGMTEQEHTLVYAHADPVLLSSLTNQGFTGTYLVQHCIINGE